MLSILILRLTLVMKWLLQIIGIILPIFIFWQPQYKAPIVIASTIFIAIPELVMATVLWISKGIISFYKTKNSEQAHIDVPVFDDISIHVSAVGYMFILVSLATSIGLFLDIPILTAGITVFLCFVWQKNLKNFLTKYLTMNV
jgi:hypothetical protein